MLRASTLLPALGVYSYYTTPLSSIYMTTIYTPCTLFPPSLPSLPFPRPPLSFPSAPSFSLPLLWHALISSPPNVPPVYRLLFFFPRPFVRYLPPTSLTHVYVFSFSFLRLSPSRAHLSLSSPSFLSLPSPRNDIHEHELVELELTRVGDSFSFSRSLPLSLLSSYSYAHAECAARNSSSQWIYCVSESSSVRACFPDTLSRESESGRTYQ